MSKVARYRAFLVELLVVATGVTGLGFVVSQGFAAHRKPEAPSLAQVESAAPEPRVESVLAPTPEPEVAAGPEVVAAEPAPAPLPAEPAAPVGPPPLTSLPLTLVATNVARDGELSTAVIDDRAYGTLVYGVADGLPGGGPIVAISPRYVDFLNHRAGRVERLDLLGEAAPAPVAEARPAPAVARKTAPSSPSAELDAEVDAAISKKGDGHYTVSRGFVDKVLANPMVMMGQLRARPTAEGLKLYGVKAGSAAAKIGLKAGDVITALNGHQTAGGNLDKMLELYSKLKSASSMSVELKRGGKPMSLEYLIQ